MISFQCLHKIRSEVENIFGWNFTEDRIDDLERGLLEAARELGVNGSAAEIEKWLTNISWTEKESAILSSHLTIGETYFFREKPYLDTFQNHIIPEMIRERTGKDQSIRIWSAGCCSGEEPYSLAVILNETIPDLQNWNITILGTDINQNFLAKARQGRYTSWSFRETSQLRKERYFSQCGNAWQIDQKIQKQVTFATLNLANDLYPSLSNNTQNTDVIFCRNVLMYFTPQQIRKIVDSFYQSLNENGWLIVSAVELNNDYFGQFDAVRIGSCTVYQKSRKRAQKDIIHDRPGRDKIRTGDQVISKGNRLSVPFFVKLLQPSSKKEREKIKIAESNAIYLFKQGNFDKCALLCESTLLKVPENIEILTILIRSKISSGQLEEASRWARKLALLPNVTADHFYLIANILFERNEINSAEEALRKALFLNPHHLMSHFLLGKIRKQLKTKDAALKHFQNVRELLDQFGDESLVPGSEGLTAGKFRELLTNLI